MFTKLVDHTCDAVARLEAWQERCAFAAYGWIHAHTFGSTTRFWSYMRRPVGESGCPRRA